MQQPCTRAEVGIGLTQQLEHVDQLAEAGDCAGEGLGLAARCVDDALRLTGIAGAIGIAEQSRDRIGTPSRSTTRKGTRRLDPCPICGRHSGRGGSELWCEETADGLILCMPGSTFSAEQKHGPLQIKDVVDGYALVKRSPIAEGDVLVFRLDRPWQKPDRKPMRPSRPSRAQPWLGGVA